VCNPVVKEDRIGSQIFNTLSGNSAIARTITSQEAKLDAVQAGTVYVPSSQGPARAREIGFEQRIVEYIDNGVVRV
jgi:magnesium chelatase subunit I